MHSLACGVVGQPFYVLQSRHGRYSLTGTSSTFLILQPQPVTYKQLLRSEHRSAHLDAPTGSHTAGKPR